mmetsp:Transcript_3009/g.3447  ORF Transcript_3009/g.3447 Transcript_3009/m.3447 type:complete len:138 (+) Transcript_3009:143-556(+)
MQRNYLTVKQFLENEFPELRGKIDGGNPPIPPHVVLQQQILSIIHMIAVAFIFLGDTLWNMIPFMNGPPRWYQACKAYPMQTFLALFFFIPTLIQSQVTTGAFEILCDGDVMFSKIESGRFPNGPELVEMFQGLLKK